MERWFFLLGASSNSSRIIIVGAGVIGLSIAWRLARENTRDEILLLDANRAGEGTSRVSAGMIAPIAEAGFEDPHFIKFARLSRERYRAFVSEVSRDADMPVVLGEEGSIIVAIHRDDVEAMRRVYEHRRHAELPVEWLTGTEAREMEPTLTPRVSAAMWIAYDGQVNPRALLPALVRACNRRGVEVRESARVQRIVINDETVAGVELDGETITADTVVVCAGAWSGTIDGMPADVVPQVRPIRGQILRLTRTTDFAMKHVVRGPRAYLLPKDDGTVVVGATQEEAGFDATPTAGGIKTILENAWEMVPSIYDLPIERVEVGLRPGTRDHLPLVGATRIHGLIMATGHFRHGILFAPTTADAVCRGILTGDFGEDVAAFAPDRFASTR
ncbi:MAG TPA: glycine oxidase ThiO [Candidatus Krumholzibacteria bacterium]|nr:glycine oxidase ThiO [Candidatus Krumholzibacteria bacterium]